MAQLFVDVIIKNTTNNGKSDHFWDACEMNLLKALVLYVDQGYAEENRNIGEVYRLLTLNGESQLDTLFEALPSTHPAKAPYSLFKQASDTVRSGVIIGLGSRLQVFQSELIKKLPLRMRSIWSFRVSSPVPTSSLPATRTAPLIFWPRCFYLSASSNWCDMQTTTARAANCLCLSISLGKN